MNRNLMTQANDNNTKQFSWGRLSWLADAASTPEAEQIFGEVYIQPGMRNPRHMHPSCEEAMYLISGTCDYSIGEEVYSMTPGCYVRIPKGVPHTVQCTSDNPAYGVVLFPGLDRTSVSFESDELA